MSATVVEISLAKQRLRVRLGDETRAEFPVATARNGAGELAGSECTPRGWHAIFAKVGAGCAPGSVFVGRKPTGETYSPELRQKYPDRDWILTRILWLTGLEEGRNRSGKVDTKQRFIYIHGAPDDDPMGVPSSHGCVKMRNSDVIELFDMVEEGTRVNICE